MNGRPHRFAETGQRRWAVASAEVLYQLFAGTAEPPFDLVFRLAARGADADAAGLAIKLDGAASTGWVVHRSFGPLGGAAVGQPVAADSAAGQVLESGRPLLVGRTTAGSVGGTLLCVPLRCGERMVGVLTVARGRRREPFTTADKDHFAAFAHDAGVALALDRARAERDIAARVHDHERIAADLHDHVIQSLFAVGMGLEGMLHLMPRRELEERISAYVDTIDDAIHRIRATIYPHPDGPPSEPVGLGDALVEVLQEETVALGFVPRFERRGPIDTIPAELAQDVLAVVREALSNTARHAHAAHALVRVGLVGHQVSVDVSDDGDGIGPTTRSSGMSNLRRRAAAHNGTLKLSVPVAGGTALQWTADLAR